MNFEEFLKPEENVEEDAVRAEVEENATYEDNNDNIEVQKVVVEELAADKVRQEEHISLLEQEKLDLQQQINTLQQALADKERQLAEQANAVQAMEAKVQQLNQLQQTIADLEKQNNQLIEDINLKSANRISLLDKNLEVNDRFSGETREHILEIIKTARDEAEQVGRVRRAQLMEAVLVANESSGELNKRREALRKYFNDNYNIISGTVIEELNRCGIAYKNGEEYLTPDEIIKRTY